MITLEILAAYLPHHLKLQRKATGGIYELEWVNKAGQIAVRQAMRVTLNEQPDNYLPILRPLSGLKGNHHHLGLLDTDYAKLANYIYDGDWSLPLFDTLSYSAVQKLLSDHYNIFNLPEGEYVRK